MQQSCGLHRQTNVDQMWDCQDLVVPKSCLRNKSLLSEVSLSLLSSISLPVDGILIATVSSVSRVWQAWLVPWAPLRWGRKIAWQKSKFVTCSFFNLYFMYARTRAWKIFKKLLDMPQILGEHVALPPLATHMPGLWLWTTCWCVHGFLKVCLCWPQGHPESFSSPRSGVRSEMTLRCLMLLHKGSLFWRHWWTDTQLSFTAPTSICLVAWITVAKDRTHSVKGLTVEIRS